MTKRAVVDIVRTAALGSYGVTGFAHRSLLDRIAAALRLAPAGIRVRVGQGLDVELWLTVAFGLPIAEVARQVDSAVRYAVRRATGHEIDSLVIHVNRLRVLPAGASGAAPAAGPPGAEATAVAHVADVIGVNGPTNAPAADAGPADSATAPR